jgi:hypothetical protein
MNECKTKIKKKVKAMMNVKERGRRKTRGKSK